MENNNCLVEDMCRYIGQTVTVFTTSGGASGCGFTGVLISVDCGCIRLLNRIGEAPSCPVGSSCCGGYENGNGYGNGCGNSGYGNGCGCGNSGYGNGCGCGNSGYGNGCGCGNSGCDNGYDRRSINPLGAVTEIPICNIASFTHNAI